MGRRCPDCGEFGLLYRYRCNEPGCVLVWVFRCVCCGRFEGRGKYRRVLEIKKGSERRFRPLKGGGDTG